VSCDIINVTASASYKVAPLLRRVLRASLQHDPGVGGANAGVVQCFFLSSVVGRGNVLVSRYLRPKSIADIFPITLFTSSGDNSINI